MVGRFEGWLIQNSTGSSSTTSFALQDCTSPVAWFSICRKCLWHSIWTILYLGLCFRSHLLGCLLLKYTLPPIFKGDGVLSSVFCAVLKWFSSNVFLASWCTSRFNFPESGSPKNHCMGSSSWCKGKFGSLLYTRKNGVSAVTRLGVTL